jgi:hypothetical protein
MGPKRMQLLTCVLLCMGGAGLLASGHVMGGGTAIGVGALLGLITLGTPSR